MGDLTGDGTVEIAYGDTVWSGSGGLEPLWSGGAGYGAAIPGREITYFVDVDGDGAQELLAGNVLYDATGEVVWRRDDLMTNSGLSVPGGFSAIADLDADGTPEVVFVWRDLWVLDALTGTTELAVATLPGESTPGDRPGGPPTIADFDGDGDAEIGIAAGAAYQVYEADFAAGTLEVAWSFATKDTSSAVTSSSVFDFEGDGRVEVVYSDECFLYVLDGTDGTLRYSLPNTTFTGTEAMIVADIDGDDHAEILRVSNRANYGCDTAPWTQADPSTGRVAWEPPDGQASYRGLTALGDAANSWADTRSLWNQSAYYVSNVCDGEDSGCEQAQFHGQIPSAPAVNWELPWLNNFRQNVQADGVLDAPDIAVNVSAPCAEPLTLRVEVRNVGRANLPPGLDVEVTQAGTGDLISTVTTSLALVPGQTEFIEVGVPAGVGGLSDAYSVRVPLSVAASVNDCQADNDQSEPIEPSCDIEG